MSQDRLEELRCLATVPGFGQFGSKLERIGFLFAQRGRQIEQ